MHQLAGSTASQFLLFLNTHNHWFMAVLLAAFCRPYQLLFLYLALSFFQCFLVRVPKETDYSLFCLCARGCGHCSCPALLQVTVELLQKAVGIMWDRVQSPKAASWHKGCGHRGHDWQVWYNQRGKNILSVILWCPAHFKTLRDS